MADVEAQHTPPSPISEEADETPPDLQKNYTYNFLDNPTSISKDTAEYDDPFAKKLHWFKRLILRSSSVPWRILILMIFWSAFITTMAWLAGRDWDGRKDCRWFVSSISILPLSHSAASLNIILSWK